MLLSEVYRSDSMQTKKQLLLRLVNKSDHCFQACVLYNENVFCSGIKYTILFIILIAVCNIFCFDGCICLSRIKQTSSLFSLLQAGSGR